MADGEDTVEEVTITYNGPGDLSIAPVTAKIDRVVQTVVWNLVDNSGLNAQFAVPGGIEFPWPPPSPPPAYSKWNPPGDTPTGNGTRYQASANDVIPHGSPRKLYKYDILIERDATPEENTSSRTTERVSADDVIKKMGGNRVEEEFDPPVENQPLP